MDLDLKIISATDLKELNLFTSKIHPYVVVSISGTTKKTPVDSDGGQNPTWNHPLTFSVPVDRESDLVVTFKIHSRRCCLTGDELIGEVCVPLRDFVGSGSVSYQVKKPSGRARGVLNFSYRLTDNLSGLGVSEDPVFSSPTNPQASCAEELYPPPRKQELMTGYPTVGGYEHNVYPPPVVAAPSFGYPGVDVSKYEVYPPQVDAGYGYPLQSEHGYPHIGNEYPGQAGYGYGYDYRR